MTIDVNRTIDLKFKNATLRVDLNPTIVSSPFSWFGFTHTGMFGCVQIKGSDSDVDLDADVVTLNLSFSQFDLNEEKKCFSLEGTRKDGRASFFDVIFITDNILNLEKIFRWAIKIPVLRSAEAFTDCTLLPEPRKFDVNNYISSTHAKTKDGVYVFEIDEEILGVFK